MNLLFNLSAILSFCASISLFVAMSVSFFSTYGGLRNRKIEDKPGDNGTKDTKEKDIERGII